MTDWGRGEILGPFLFAAYLTWLSVTKRRLWFLSIPATIIIILILGHYAD